MLVPMPNWRDISLAMANWSPVTILTFTPICTALAMVALACSARRIGHGQHANELPLVVLIGAGHAQRAEAACGKIVDRFVDLGLHVCDVGGHLQDDLRRSLRDLELFPVRAFHGGFGALMHRVEGLEMNDLILLQLLIVLDAGDHGEVDGVFVSAREANAASRMI